MTIDACFSADQPTSRPRLHGGVGGSRGVLLRCLAVVAVVPVALAVSACDPPPAPKFEIVVSVASDPGRPLANAAITGAGKELGKTGNDGTVTLALAAREGESLDIYVTCPAGFQSPPKPISVVFRKLPDGKRPEYPAACPPTERAAVISVQVDVDDPRDIGYIANLPVNYLGSTYARTDASGAGHFVVPIGSDDQMTVILDTSSVPEMVPKNPTATISAHGQDDIYAVKFGTLHVPHKAAARPRAKPKPKGPTRLGE
jgi:hypothetical protein